MIINKPLTELVNDFLSMMSRVSTKENSLGFIVETRVEVIQEYNHNFYRVTDVVSEKGVSIGLKVPSELNRKLSLNTKYNVMGHLELFISGSTIYVNLIAKEIQLYDGSSVPVNINILDQIKKLPLSRRKFPPKTDLEVFLICPKQNNSEAVIDIESNIKSYNLIDNVHITKELCSITNPRLVAEAIKKMPKNTDILIIARGGGDKLPIQALDNELIVDALKDINAYKIMGIGHASDRLAIEMMFDYVSATPRDIITKIFNEIQLINRLKKLGLQNYELEKALQKNNQESQDTIEISELEKQITDLKNYNYNLKKKLDSKINNKENNVDYYKYGFFLVVLLAIIYIIRFH